LVQVLKGVLSAEKFSVGRFQKLPPPKAFRSQVAPDA